MTIITFQTIIVVSSKIHIISIMVKVAITINKQLLLTGFPPISVSAKQYCQTSSIWTSPSTQAGNLKFFNNVLL